MIDCVRTGIRETFEADYEGLIMSVVHMHDTITGEYENFGIKMYCERLGRGNCAEKLWSMDFGLANQP